MERCNHSTCVTITRRVRDGFRRRYWVRCWNCDLQLGPMESQGSAYARARLAQVGVDNPMWSRPNGTHPAGQQ